MEPKAEVEEMSYRSHQKISESPKSMLASIWTSITGTNHLTVLSVEMWMIRDIEMDGPQLGCRSGSFFTQIWMVHVWNRRC
jgi:hypothetical protein